MSKKSRITEALYNLPILPGFNHLLNVLNTALRKILTRDEETEEAQWKIKLWMFVAKTTRLNSF